MPERGWDVEVLVAKFRLVGKDEKKEETATKKEIWGVVWVQPQHSPW